MFDENEKVARKHSLTRKMERTGTGIWIPVPFLCSKNLKNLFFAIPLLSCYTFRLRKKWANP
jgi:hypothetical protein